MHKNFKMFNFLKLSFQDISNTIQKNNIKRILYTSYAIFLINPTTPAIRNDLSNVLKRNSKYGKICSLGSESPDAQITKSLGHVERGDTFEN